jgi:hypothetical protein
MSDFQDPVSSQNPSELAFFNEAFVPDFTSPKNDLNLTEPIIPDTPTLSGSPDLPPPTVPTIPPGNRLQG